MTFHLAIKRVNGEIGLAIRAKTVAAALLAPKVTWRDLSQAEDLRVEKQHGIRIQRIVGDVANAREAFFFARRNTEAAGGNRDRPALGIVNADLAVVEIVCFLDDRSARVEFHEAAFDFFQVVDLQADVVQSEFHVHFAEAWSFFEKSQIVVTIGDGNISLRRAAEFLGTEKTPIKVSEFFRLICEIGDVTNCSHGNPPGKLECWSNGLSSPDLNQLSSTPSLHSYSS